MDTHEQVAVDALAERASQPDSCADLLCLLRSGRARAFFVAVRTATLAIRSVISTSAIQSLMGQEHALLNTHLASVLSRVSAIREQLLVAGGIDVSNDDYIAAHYVATCAAISIVDSEVRASGDGAIITLPNEVLAQIVIPYSIGAMRDRLVDTLGLSDEPQQPIDQESCFAFEAQLLATIWPYARRFVDLLQPRIEAEDALDEQDDGELDDGDDGFLGVFALRPSESRAYAAFFDLVVLFFTDFSDEIVRAVDGGSSVAELCKKQLFIVCAEILNRAVSACSGDGLLFTKNAEQGDDDGSSAWLIDALLLNLEAEAELFKSAILLLLSSHKERVARVLADNQRASSEVFG